MLEPMALIRALHYAATLLTSGTFAFWAFIVLSERSAIIAVRHRTLVAVGAGAALLSAVLWLGAQAAALPAHSADASLVSRSLDILGGTGFGRAWMVRLALLAALLLLSLLTPTRSRLGAAALLGLAATATLAFAGHAAVADPLSRSADMLHLVLAALWLGSLAPLVALLRLASRDESARALDDARAATRRFSAVGVACVGGLLVTGIVSAWTLVGTIPGLIGTSYGRLLTLKIMLFLSMVGVAAVNRQVLTPALVGAGAMARRAAHRLARNAFIEVALGLLILLDVGALGISVPAVHDQVSWPLPVTWGLGSIAGKPLWTTAAAVAAVLACAGIGWMAVAALRGWRGIALGGAAALGGIALGGVALSEAAVPTVYLNSPLPYTVATVAAGAHSFVEQCVACHGPHGYGDGPAAEGLPVKPADLARHHVGSHTDGTLFWWISHGKGKDAMPAFADLLDAQQRWELVSYLHAQFDAEAAQRLGPRLDPALRIVAPDFAFERGASGQQTLGMLREAWSVLLVLYTLPASQARLKSLAGAAKQLDLGGLRIIAAPLGEGVEKGPIFAPGDPDLVTAYGLFRKRAGEETAASDHLEFFIDAWGYLRARFGIADAPTPRQLVAMMEAVDREPPPPPVAQATGGHSH
jgi:putative copper export protein/mono/diheme cytochrome c family protein